MAQWHLMFGEDSDSDTESPRQVLPAQEMKYANSGATSLADERDQRYVEVKECIVEGIGGGRGIFARMDLLPGCLVLSEISSMGFRDESDLDDPVEFIHAVEEVIRDPKAMECAHQLHPMSIDDASYEDVERMRLNWSADDLYSLASKLRCSQIEIIRVGLTLQHNGFSSGLYHTLTKVNHSCSPNCIKFKPAAQSNWASEIWTIRPVREGEELTICYCEPVEMTLRSMREYLLTQHRFVDMSQAVEKEDDGESELLADLDKRQEILAMAERELSFIDIEDHPDRLRICKRMMAFGENSLLKEVNKLLDQGKEGGYSTALRRSLMVMKIRILKHLVHAAAISIQSYPQTRGVKKSVLNSAICTYVGASDSLLGLQREFWGNDHCDLGTTNADLAEGLRCLLTSISPDGFRLEDAVARLQAAPYSLLSDAVADLASLRSMMASAEAEARRLEALYNTRVKYPGALSVLREPGDLFWGTVRR